MRGMPGIRHQPGVRRLPRPGRAGGSVGFASVPRLRCGGGSGGTLARDGSSRGVVTSVPCCVTVRNLTGRETPARSRSALRSAARSFPAASSRDALRALQSALVGVQPATALAPRPGAQARRRRPAAGPCRQRRASVVTSAQRTARRSERASDDAETGNRQSTESVDAQRRKRVAGRAPAVGWSGARWCQGSSAGFSSGNPLRSDDRRQQAENRNGGLLFGAGGMLYFRAF